MEGRANGFDMWQDPCKGTHLAQFKMRHLCGPAENGDRVDKADRQSLIPDRTNAPTLAAFLAAAISLRRSRLRSLISALRAFSSSLGSTGSGAATHGSWYVTLWPAAHALSSCPQKA